jgi:hypothetical protein
MTEIEERLKGIEDFIASGGVSKMNAGVSTYNAKWLCELVRSQQSELARLREALCVTHREIAHQLSRYNDPIYKAYDLIKQLEPLLLEALTAAPGEKE